MEYLLHLVRLARATGQQTSAGTLIPLVPAGVLVIPSGRPSCEKGLAPSSKELCNRGAELAANLAECVVDVAGHNAHSERRRKSDQSREQRVLDQVLTGLLTM